ncbi:hypothetical protein GP475_03450 [Corynebacterium poyangense]|uniref:Uncharacterized protein n=1 Tax=Corynebacterium poyangense TaxID=2684405 RepID=A0A7H0SMN4_9CORY|nr:thiamine pyrophosphate-binding protein [Corynebacterium poyangense]MBZ8176917.1 hypothetical protein [Corynebacterium poyangense]QNQ89809.1 hypothetical protein GP475_03450 [Corynebacterium poyangense]
MKLRKALTDASGPDTSEWGRFRNELVGGRRGADYVLGALAQDGVSVMFGLPADSINSLFDAARKHSGIRVVTCHHETHGTLMASAFGKLSGTPAIMTATNGPGVGHLPVGARDAFLDEAPLVLLPGTVPHSMAGMRGFQDLNGEKLLEPWADGIFRCESIAGLSRIKVVAPRAKHSKRPVVFISAPDVLMDPCSIAVDQTPTLHPASQWSSNCAAVERAASIIDEAVSSVILLGDSRNSPTELPESVYSMAYISPSSLQGSGWGKIPTCRRILPSATYLPWSGDEVAVIVVGDWPNELENQLTNIAVIHLTKTPSWRVETGKYINLCGTIASDFLEKHMKQAKVEFSPPASNDLFSDVVPLINRVSGEADLISCEPGTVLESVFLHLEERNRTFTSSFAAATKGYGIPGAIAGAILDNTRLNIAVVDEAGWVESQIEVTTALKHGCHIAVIYLAIDEEEVQRCCLEGKALGLNVRVIEGLHTPDELRPFEMLILRTHRSSSRSPEELQFSGRQRWQLASSCTSTSRLESQESFAMQAVAAAKTLGEVSIIEVRDECTLLRILNPLADAAMDGAAVVLVAHEEAWNVSADRILPELAHSNFCGSFEERETLVEMAKVASSTSSTVSLVRIQSGATVSRIERRTHRTQNCSQLALPQPSSIEQCKAILESAQNAVILVGGGAKDRERIALLATKLDAPILATMAGAQFDSLSCFGGYVGSSGQRHSNTSLREAEVVLMLGVSNRGAAFELVGNSKVVLDVNSDLETLASRKFDSLSIHSDSSTFVTALLKSEIKKASDNSHQLSYMRSTWWDNAGQVDTLAGKLRPSYVVRQLDESLPADRGFAFTGDVGINTLWLFRFRKHHASTIWSRNFATMGFGLPAALARVKFTGQPTVAVVGDGGMGMSIGAITPDCESPVLCVVLNNRGLAAIRYEQEFFGWPEFESGYINPDFAAFARSRSWDGRTITTKQELRKAINDFVVEPSPMLLDVVCTENEPPMPALIPKPVRVASALFAWARQGRKGLVSARTALSAMIFFR